MLLKRYTKNMSRNALPFLALQRRTMILDKSLWSPYAISFVGQIQT